MKNGMGLLFFLMVHGSWLVAEEGCAKSSAKVVLASAEAQRAAGIVLADVRSVALAETVDANGRAAFDADRTARISPRAPGILREIRRGIGERVAAGETLLVVDSAQLGEAKAAFLTAVAAEEIARAEAEREKLLAARSATTQKEALAAAAQHAKESAELTRSRGKLRTLGLSEDDIRRVERERDLSTELAVASPVAGTVVALEAVAGEMLDPAKPVLTVTDLARLWVMADLFEADIAKVAVGQKAVFTADAYPGRRFEGTVRWVSALVDPESRTLPVRIEVENAGEALKANLFGKARISVRETKEALVVPKEAVQWEGCCHMVFVPDGPRTYQAKRVRIGFAGEETYEILAGVSAGEKVVTTGSFILKTEVLKSSIGAG